MTVRRTNTHRLTAVLIALIRRKLQHAGKLFKIPVKVTPRACANLLFVSHCLGGLDGTSNLLAGKLFKNLKIPVKETHTHARIHYSSLIA